jgi:flagellar biosynthesis protein FlhG
MRDQAEKLRDQLRDFSQITYGRTLAVISGKGGVGKSNFSLNFSICLSQKGYRVLLFDMDIGMGNIDILMGNSSDKNIVDFFQKGMSLEEIITKGPENVSFISGATGLSFIFQMTDHQFLRFQEEFQKVLEKYDYIIFDMGAGISQESSKFIRCVDDIITITTPEPTSIMDGYSIIKYITSLKKDIPFFLVCNRVQNEKEGKETIARLQNAIRKFLQKEITPLGYIPDNKLVSKAVSRQIPFLLFSPQSDVSLAIEDITLRYVDRSTEGNLSIRKNNFLGRLKNIFARK